MGDWWQEGADPGSAAFTRATPTTGRSRSSHDLPSQHSLPPPTTTILMAHEKAGLPISEDPEVPLRQPNPPSVSLAEREYGQHSTSFMAFWES